MVLSLAVSFSALAQDASGILFNRDVVTLSSLVSFSQRESAGTARSMGMGGAFTSLGGDMASLGYNPAGFGMYSRNEVSVTLGADIIRTKNYNAYTTGDNTLFRVAVNNVGASFKVYEGTGKLTAVNFAFGYNKIADYNYSIAYGGATSAQSLARSFADIANANGLAINAENKITDSRGYIDYEMNPYYWGTVMAYKAGLINGGASGWILDEVGAGAQFAPYTNLQSRGSSGEFSFAFGFNFNNIVYLGASLDVMSISRKQTLYYDEYISYAEGETPDAAAYPYLLRNFRFGQSVSVSGSGVGAKFGVVVRPVKELRIGVALHTPSYYSMSYRYVGALSSTAASIGSNPNGWDVVDGNVYAEESTPILKDDGEYRWNFTTPLRLLGGISYAIGPYAIISADYEYSINDLLKWNYTPVDDPGYNNADIRRSLRGTHTIRAGVEGKPLPWLSLRVGGGYRTALLADGVDAVQFSEPTANKLWYASAGVGFRVSEVTSIDLAYQYRNTRYSNYYTYYTEWSAVNATPLYGLDIVNHNIALTFAFRF